jgi:hypothetical protein
MYLVRICEAFFREMGPEKCPKRYRWFRVSKHFRYQYREYNFNQLPTNARVAWAVSCSDLEPGGCWTPYN